MSKNSKKTWNTKYGSRRVRHEAPTLEEAIAAAQGLSDEVDAQAEIAAALIGMPQDQVRAAMPKAVPARKLFIKTVVYAGPASAPRAVAVERKPVRRAISPAARAVRPAFGDSRGI